MSIKPAGLSTGQSASHPSGKTWSSSLKKGTAKPAIGKKKPMPTVVKSVFQPSKPSKQDLAGVLVIRHFGSLQDLVPAKTTQAVQPRLVGKRKPKAPATVDFTPAPKPEQPPIPTPPVLQPVSLTLAPSNPSDLEPAFSLETAPWAHALSEQTDYPPAAAYISHLTLAEAVPPPRASKERFMISNPQVAQVLFGQHAVLREMLPEAPEMALDESVHWGRDCRVCLPSGEHLIPYSIPDFHRPDERIRCLLSEEEEHFHTVATRGRGFSPEYRGAAIDHAVAQGVKIKHGRSCIEGGNCRIFRGSDGQHRALVGRNSILWTVIALERQGEFESPEFRKFAKEYAAQKKSPSPDSLRIARNCRLFEEDRTHFEPGNPDSREPGSRTLAKGGDMRELIQYWDEALEFEARCVIARRSIAIDLDIPEDRIAYLAQSQFHIDLECFNGSGNAVFIHSEAETLDLLANLRRTVRGKDAPLLEKYIEQSKAKLSLSEKIVAANIRAVEAIGCKPIPIAGDFTAEGNRVNFMNAVLVLEGEEQVLMTNGTANSALNHFLKADFQGRVEDHCPALKILFAADQTAVLQRELNENQGGLHCMTWKNPVD